MSPGTGAVEALLARIIGPGPAGDLVAATGGGPDAGLRLEGLPIETAPHQAPAGSPGAGDATLIR